MEIRNKNQFQCDNKYKDFLWIINWAKISRMRSLWVWMLVNLILMRQLINTDNNYIDKIHMKIVYAHFFVFIRSFLLGNIYECNYFFIFLLYVCVKTNSFIAWENTIAISCMWCLYICVYCTCWFFCLLIGILQQLWWRLL